MMSTSPLRKAASLAAGSSSRTNFTSSPYFCLYCDAALGSSPPLHTMPGACPAHVLMATTSGRESRPDCPSATDDTPVEPALRLGSGGAFFRASKSVEVTAALGDAAPSCLPTDHSRT